MANEIWHVVLPQIFTNFQPKHEDKCKKQNGQ